MDNNASQAVEFARINNAVDFSSTMNGMIKSQIADKINTIKSDLVKQISFK